MKKTLILMAMLTANFAIADMVCEQTRTERQNHWSDARTGQGIRTTFRTNIKAFFSDSDSGAQTFTIGFVESVETTASSTQAPPTTLDLAGSCPSLIQDQNEVRCTVERKSPVDDPRSVARPLAGYDLSEYYNTGVQLVRKDGKIVLRFGTGREISCRPLPTDPGSALLHVEQSLLGAERR